MHALFPCISIMRTIDSDYANPLPQWYTCDLCDSWRMGFYILRVNASEISKLPLSKHGRLTLNQCNYSISNLIRDWHTHRKALVFGIQLCFAQRISEIKDFNAHGLASLIKVFSFASYDVNAMWKCFYNAVSAARIKNAIKQFPTRNNAWRLSITFRTTHSMSLNISAHYISSDPACRRWISINSLRLRDIIYVARAINHALVCMLWMNA